MQKIRKLAPDVVAKIAAGEVIERPAYAIKELIENSIDANASLITINIEESGLKRIQIIDNGEGMSREDLEICFLPHTTSKIKDEDELVGIKTLGFRGEALYSIAAISSLTIQSRQKNNSSGTVVEIRQGRVEHIGKIGTPLGTIVTVENLFSSIPARKKFLKSPQTEFRHIAEIILYFILSYPRIHFMLTNNKKVIFDVPVKNDPTERLSLAFGDDLPAHFLPLKFRDSYLTISGYIGKPNVALKNNRSQFIFVNNRSISDKLISLAVKESFGTLLFSSATPVFVLYLNLPFEIVDVNVHPRKEKVSFINQRLIFDLVKQAVSETLMEHNITYNIETFDSIKKGETTSYSGKALKDIVIPWNRTEIGNVSTRTSILQIHQTYILVVTRLGIVLIDQHAAHERILFEQFVQMFKQKKRQHLSYTLPKPYKLSVSLLEKQLFEEHKDVFKNIGFYLEEFGTNIYLIREIPLIFKERNLEKIIKDMFSDLSENIGVRDIDRASERMLTFLSCRAAIKAGDSLTQKQIRTIVSDLEKSPNNSTCPHGRPTKIILSLELLHKYFKRI